MRSRNKRRDRHPRLRKDVAEAVGAPVSGTVREPHSVVCEANEPAGRIARIEMMNDALKVVKTLDEIDDATRRINDLLHELSVYTGEDYVIEDLEV